MADLNALIAQGAQFNLPNPVDQYSKVMQLQAAQQQMQVNRQQMQQLQEDRAGFAKLREKLAQQNMTPEDYEEALKQSPDPTHQKLGIEMGFRRVQLANLDKALEKTRGVGVAPAMPAIGAPTDNVAVPTAQTFDTSAAMVQPGKAYADMRPGERIQFDINRLTNPELTKPQAVYQVGGQPVPFGDYVNANIANSAGAGERAAMAAMPNALAARVAPAEPVANAMTAKQAQLEDIRKQLAVLTKPQYSDIAGVKDQIASLREEQKRLSESPLGKIDLDKFEPTSVAAYLASGNLSDLKRAETKAGGRYLSLGAGKALDQDTGQIISVDKVPSAAATKIVKIGSVPYTVDAQGTLVPVPIQGGAGKAATGGAAKLKAPSGYRYDATGENLEPIPGGPADKTKEGPAKEGAATEGERKAATLLQRLQFSEGQLTEALVQDPNAAKPGVFASAVAKLSTPLANTLTPEARQRVQSAQLDILDAALTLGTGAAYTREQLEGYRDAYFPQLGDKPNAIKDKQARLNNVISAAKIAAGKAARLVPALPAPAAGSGEWKVVK